MNKLVEAVARNLVEKRITAVGQEEWAQRAATENLTVDQFTTIEIWSATGPVKYQTMGLTDEVLDALADLVGIEIPPVFVEDRPKLNLVGYTTTCASLTSRNGFGLPANGTKFRSWPRRSSSNGIPDSPDGWATAFTAPSPSEPEFGLVCRSGREPRKRKGGRP
jgi:hypothetical protein